MIRVCVTIKIHGRYVSVLVKNRHGYGTFDFYCTLKIMRFNADLDSKMKKYWTGPINLVIFLSLNPHPASHYLLGRNGTYHIRVTVFH